MATSPQPGPRRPYSSSLRATQARATREQIVRAAGAEFATRGYGAVTIEGVARSASVSIPTVYAVFGSKAGLLSAVLEATGSDPDIREMAAAVRNEANPRRRMELAARVVRTIMEREQPILVALDEAGSGSPELVAARRQVHAQQQAALRSVLEPIHATGALRGGLELEEAAATFAALASVECHRHLVLDVGWTGERWERWLAESACRLLLAD